MDDLTAADMSRYSRHLLLPEVGIEGQQRLKAGRVVIIGAGGLGSPVLLYLAAAGVGNIGIVEFDQIDVSNLQRQILYASENTGASKSEHAAARARALNPEITITIHETRLAADNALDILKSYDVVVDGTDNFSTRYLVNDACVMLGKPCVYGSIYRFEGQASVFAAPGSPCYRCLFPDPPNQSEIPSCAEGGVLGAIAGVIGCIQATETLKLLLGIGSSLAGRLLLFDSLAMSFDTLTLEKTPFCPVCGSNPKIKTLTESAISCAAPPTDKVDEVKAKELSAELKGDRRPFLLDVRNPEEQAICTISGAQLIPLNQIEERYKELDPNVDTVVYCKSGVRSQKAINLLRNKGFSKLRNLNGGIKAWIKDVDPTLTDY